MNLVPFKGLRDRGIPYSREHIRRLVIEELFPQPVKIGGGLRSKNAWLEDEIDAWIKQRAAARPTFPPRGQPMAKADDRDRPSGKSNKHGKSSSSLRRFPTGN